MKQNITSSMLLLLLCSLMVQAKTSGCVAKTQTLSLFPSLNEKLIWSLNDGLFEGSDLTYQLTDDAFKIIKPIESTGGSSSHIQTAQNIRSVKPYHTKEVQAWLNSFVFLDQGTTEISLFYSEGNAQDRLPTPDFSTKVKIDTVTDNLQCYDVEYIDSDKFIVDCQKNKIVDSKMTYIDVFYVYSKTTNKVTKYEEEAPLQIFNKRSLGLFYYTSITGKVTTYLIRVTPTYSLSNTNTLTGNSLVSVYIIGDNYAPKSLDYVLDNATMAFLLGKQQIEFSIVDFEISFNGFLFLLDAQYGLYVVQFNPNGSWSLISQFDPQIGKIFAFDIDYEHKKDGSELGIIAMLGYNFFVVIDVERQYIQDIPFLQLEYPATIQISEDNIIVRNNQYAYFYKIDPNSNKIYLNTKYQVTASDILIVNPYEPDFIHLNLRNSYRFTISTGYLQYVGSAAVKDTKTVSLKATAPNAEVCQILITYKILEDNENWIYELPEHQKPFPNTITEATTRSYLKSLASGPNLQYNLNTQLSASTVAVDVRSRWTLDVPDTQWPNNIIYSTIISREDNTKFYQAIQTADFMLQIWSCEHKSLYDSKTTCNKVVSQIVIGSKITKHTFSIWINFGVLYFMYLDTPYSLSIKAIDDQMLVLTKRIQLDTSDTAQEIKEILNCGDYLLIRTNNNFISSYFTYRPETFALVTLNKDSLKQYGYTEDWEPRAMFANKKIHPNLVFIVHKAHILILDTDYGYFSFLKTIKVTANLDYEIAIGEKTFFVVQGKSDYAQQDAKIYEYNFEKVNNIFLTKTLYLYWYDIQMPLAVDYSEENGTMFVRGLCLYCSKSFLLVFKPNTLQHEALVQAWPISQGVIPDGEVVLLAANGNEQMYLYLQVQGKSSLTAVLTNPVITITPAIDQDIYSTKLNLKLDVSNYNFQGKPEKFNTIQIKQDVTTIFTQTKININDAAFPVSKGVYIGSNIKQKSYQLGNDWYSGQIGSFGVDCEQCETNVSIQGVVDLVNPKIFNGYEIRDQVKYNDKFVILQATKGLLFVNPDNTLAAVYDFDLPHSNYKCYQATVSYDKLVVYSLCHDGEQYSVYATGCFSITGCSPLGAKFALGKTVAKIQVVGNEVLAVLHTSSQNPQDTEGSLVFYEIKMGVKDWSLETLDVLNIHTINSKLTTSLNDFRPSDFFVVRQYTSDIVTNTVVYKLFLSDSVNGMLFYDFTLNNLNKFTFLTIETINLYNFINEVGQYTLDTTRFLQFRFIWSPDYDWSSRMLRAYFFIQTNDAPQYGIKVIFELKETLNTAITIKGLFSIVNRYGNWPAVNKMAVHSSFKLAVPYIQGNNIVVGIYDFEIDVSNDLALPTPAIMIGSYRVFIDEGQNTNPLNMGLFFNLGQDPILFATQFIGALQSYGINKQPVLQLQNENGDLRNQTITIIARNDFSTSQISFKLEVRPVDLNECTTKVTNLLIYPSTGEKLQWSLTQGFFDGVGLKYTIDSTTDFQVVQPIVQVGAPVNHKSAASVIIAAKPLLTQNRVWQNQFAFLNQEGSKYTIFYTTTASQSTAPSFSSTQTIKKTDGKLNCVDFVELTTSIFVVDCQIQNNKFLVLLKDGLETYTDTVVTDQLVRVLNTYRLGDDHFIVRATLSVTADGDLGVNSLVELYQLSNGVLNQKATLDKTKLEALYGKPITQLNIVDVKIGLNGLIYLLDAKSGIYVVYYDTEWRLKRTITYKFGQAFAFDRVFLPNSEEIFAIMGYNYFAIINTEGKITKVQDLQFTTITYPQSITLSLKYVFVKSGNQAYVYHFDDSNSSLIDIVTVKDGAFVVNPYQQDLVTVSQTASSRYIFSLGLLQFQGTTQATQVVKDITITATSQNNQVCLSKVKYQIISSQTATIYKKTDSETPLPSVLDENDEQVKLGDLVSGPNMIFDLVLPKCQFLQDPPIADFTASIVQNRQIAVTNWPKDAKLFQTSLVGNNMETLYQVFQTSDKKIVIKSCTLKDHVQYDCQDYGSVQIKEYINDQLFSIWQDSDNIIHFITIDNFYTIKFYSIPKTEIITDKTINLGDKEEQQIISLLNQGIYLFILQQNGDLSSYTINDKNDKQINIINGQTLSGFIGDWKPQKLYGNRILKQHLIFVQNENNIVLIGYPNDFVFLYKIDQIGQIISGLNTFFIVNNNIIEYNYQNVNNIYQQKIVELFGYQITNQCTQQLSTGNLIIKTIKQDKIYLSIFKPGQLQHDTYYIAIPIEKANKDTELSLSVSGPNYIITFVNSETVQQLNFILPQPELVIIPNKDNPKYISNFAAQIIVTNGNENNQIEFNQNIKIINTFTNLRVTDDNYLKTITLKQNETQSINLKADWISGQIALTNLALQQQDAITLSPYLNEKSKQLLKDYRIVHSTTFQKLPVLQAINNLLLVSNAETFEAKPAVDPLSDQYTCFRVAAYSWSLYSLCNNGVEDQVQIVNCNDKNECTRENAFISEPQGTQIAALLQDVVAVLHTDASHPENYDGYITIDHLSKVDAIWSSNTLLTINLDFIKEKLGTKAPTSFRPSSFSTVQSADDTTLYVQFIISDSVNGLVFLDVSFTKETSAVKYLFMEYQQLTVWLNEHNQYALDSTHYYQNQVIEVTNTDKKKQVLLVIVTDNASSYLFDLEFAQQDNKSNKLTSVKVKAALNRYGTWKALNYVVASASAIVIPYYNNQQITVGVYQLPKTYGDNEVLIIHGSYSFTTTEKLSPQTFLLHIQDQALVASTTDKGVTAYQILPEQVLQLDLGSKLHNQTMTLTFSNAFKHVERSIQLTIIPDDGGDDKNDSSNAWWIILIVAGSLIVLGIMGFFCYKKKKVESEEQDQEGYAPLN